MLVAVIMPVGRRVLGLARADEARSSRRSRRCSRRSRSRSRCPARTAARSSGCPTCSSSRSSSARPRASALRTGWTWLCLTASLGGDDGARGLARRRRPARAAAAVGSASCSRTRICSGERESGLDAPEIPVEVRRDPDVRRQPAATASGLVPTGIVRLTAFVAGSTTETVLSSMFGTQSLPPIRRSQAGLRRPSRSPSPRASPGRAGRSCRSRSRPRARRPSARDPVGGGQRRAPRDPVPRGVDADHAASAVVGNPDRAECDGHPVRAGRRCGSS